MHISEYRIREIGVVRLNEFDRFIERGKLHDRDGAIAAEKVVVQTKCLGSMRVDVN